MSEDKIDHALTNQALTGYSRLENSRLRGLVEGLIRHLHAFVKEVRLTDQEFETAWTLMAEMSKFTGDERNEFLLFCDVTGISQLSRRSTMRDRNKPWDSLWSAPSTELMLP